jgi:hypothetical protein
VKSGPTFGAPGTPAPPESKTGFGFIQDGAVSDLGTFLSANVFNLNPNQVRDLSTFLFDFPTGLRPAVGMQVTVAAGPPPTGSADEENLLATLISVGNAADSGWHCERVAEAPSPSRLRTYALNGGAGSGGLWITDVGGEPPIDSASLRAGAVGPLTFLGVPLGAGNRLGVDLDEDSHLNGDDCNAVDSSAWAPATEVTNLEVGPGSPTQVSWDEQASAEGPGVIDDAVGGSLVALHASGWGAATRLSGGLTTPAWVDSRPDPPVGDGYFYLTRARNSCAEAGFGPGREALDSLHCAP